MSAGAIRLPAHESRFIGREREIAELVALLSDHRLVSVCGVGGSGKTRLAVEAVGRLADRAAEGLSVSWTPLGEIQDPDLVSHALAESLGVRGPAGTAGLVRTVCDVLADTRTLLVLDNCEHVVAGCRAIVSALLAEAPEVRILLTTRVSLGVAFEHVYRIPPLDLVGEAMDLFVDRAVAVATLNALTTAHHSPIAEICARLDGLPLAIELAASRIRMLSPADLLREVERSLGLLVSTAPAAAGRHPGIEAVLSTTWQSLTTDDRVVMAGLATFVGGCTADGATAVTDVSVEQLTGLVDRSLVQTVVSDSGQLRYQLHDLVRGFATARLEAENPARVELLSRRHVDYCIALAKRWRASWNGTQGVARRGPVWEERANLDAAMRWAVEHGQSDRALRLSGALYTFWAYSTVSKNDKRERLQRALAQPWQPTDEASILARACALRTWAYCWVSIDPARARRGFEEALGWYQQLGHEDGIAWTQVALAWPDLEDGNLASADEHKRESLAIFRARGHRRGELAALSDLGQISLLAGRWAEADSQIRQSMVLADELGDTYLSFRGHLLLADMARLTRRWMDAVTEYARAWEIQREYAFTEHGADILEAVGQITTELREPAQASELLAAGLAWRERYELVRARFNQAGYALAESTVQKALGVEAWRQAVRDGARLSAGDFDRLVASAARQLAHLIARRRCGLSDRELQVLQLVAEGLNNADIAACLVLSRRTVDAHLRSIYPKLGVATRTAAAREAIRLSLVDTGGRATRIPTSTR